MARDLLARWEWAGWVCGDGGGVGGRGPGLPTPLSWAPPPPAAPSLGCAQKRVHVWALPLKEGRSPSSQPPPLPPVFSLLIAPPLGKQLKIYSPPEISYFKNKKCNSEGPRGGRPSISPSWTDSSSCLGLEQTLKNAGSSRDSRGTALTPPPPSCSSKELGGAQSAFSAEVRGKAGEPDGHIRPAACMLGGPSLEEPLEPLHPNPHTHIPTSQPFPVTNPQH